MTSQPSPQAVDQSEVTDVALPQWQPMPEDLRALLDDKSQEPPVDEGPIGQLFDAEVVAIDAAGVTLKLESGQEVFVDAQEASDRDGALVEEVGAKISVFIDDSDNDGKLLGSLLKARDIQIFQAWKERAAAGDELVEVEVQHVVRGGFAVTIDNTRGFMPGRESGIRRSDSFLYVGKTLSAELSGFDELRAQPRVSRLNVAAADNQERIDNALASLSIGQRLTGKVSRLAPFGAFIDVGGVSGLLHVSEMELKRVNDPGDILKVGDEVEVTILNIDASRGQISLSRRELLGDELREQMGKLEAGQIVDGTVVKLVPFGAFIQLAPGVEGLCHISELSWTSHVKDPAEVLEVDQAHKFKIISLDPAGRKISLSLRQVEGNPWEDYAAQNPPGSVVTAKITRIERYGLFLEVAPGVEGLCHISDLSWTQRPEEPTDVAPYEIGQSVDAKILTIEPERARIKLGIKQVESDPWEDAADTLKIGNVVKTRVARIEDPFAWVEIVPGIEGRLHVADLSVERVEHLRLALRVDQELEVMIVEADAERRRIRVSVRAIQEKELEGALRSWSEDDSFTPLAAALAPRAEAAEEPAEAEEAKAEAAEEPAEAEEAKAEAAEEPAEAAEQPAEAQDSPQEDSD